MTTESERWNAWLAQQRKPSEEDGEPRCDPPPSTASLPVATSEAFAWWWRREPAPRRPDDLFAYDVAPGSTLTWKDCYDLDSIDAIWLGPSGVDADPREWIIDFHIGRIRSIVQVPLEVLGPKLLLRDHNGEPIRLNPSDRLEIKIRHYCARARPFAVVVRHRQNAHA
jgi:hypothetical protein